MIVNFDKYEDLSKFKDMLIPKKIQGLHDKLYVIDNVSLNDKGYFMTSNLSFFLKDYSISTFKFSQVITSLEKAMTLQELYNKHPEVVHKIYEKISKHNFDISVNFFKYRIEQLKGFDVYIASKKYNL